MLGATESEATQYPTFRGLRHAVAANNARHVSKLPLASARRQGGGPGPGNQAGGGPGPGNQGGGGTPQEGQQFEQAKLDCDATLKLLEQPCGPMLKLLDSTESADTVCQQEGQAVRRCMAGIDRVITRGTTCDKAAEAKKVVENLQVTCAAAKHAECKESEFTAELEALFSGSKCGPFIEFLNLFDHAGEKKLADAEITAGGAKLEKMCATDCLAKTAALRQGKYSKCVDKKHLRLIERVGKHMCDQKGNQGKRCGLEVLEAIASAEKQPEAETFCGGCIEGFADSMQQTVNDAAVDSADDVDFEQFAGEMRQMSAEVKDGQKAICAEIGGKLCGPVLEGLKVNEITLDQLFNESANITYDQAKALATELCSDKTTRRCVQKVVGTHTDTEMSRAKSWFQECAAYQDSESCVKAHCFSRFEQKLQQIAREREMLDFICIKNEATTPEYCLAIMKQVESEQAPCFQALFHEGECKCGASGKLYRQSDMQNTFTKVTEIGALAPKLTEEDTSSGYWLFLPLLGTDDTQYDKLKDLATNTATQNTFKDFIPTDVGLDDAKVTELADAMDSNAALKDKLKELLGLLPDAASFKDFFIDTGIYTDQTNVPPTPPGECTEPRGNPCECVNKGTCTEECDDWAVELTDRMGCCMYHVGRVVASEEDRLYDVDAIPSVEVVDTINNEVKEVKLKGNTNKSELPWERNPLRPFAQCQSLAGAAFKTKAESKCKPVGKPPKRSLKLALLWKYLKDNEELRNKLVDSLNRDVANEIGVSASHIEGALVEDTGASTRRQGGADATTKYEFSIIGGSSQDDADDAAAAFDGLDSSALAKSLTNLETTLVAECTECLAGLGSLVPESRSNSTTNTSGGSTTTTTGGTSSTSSGTTTTTSTTSTSSSSRVASVIGGLLSLVSIVLM